MQELSGRGAVVIGGGSGVARSIALALGAQGANVLIGDIDGDTPKETAEMIIAAGGNGAATQVDATDRDALADVSRLATAELGRYTSWQRRLASSTTPACWTPTRRSGAGSPSSTLWP
jgi:NAD(P)-dependent dehydrogenase (short-subunit alcohol dehydrogenase family)